MATVEFMSMTNQELQRVANTVISQVAWAMKQDGLIENTEQITDRYLAVIVQKGYLARMFETWFNKDDSDGATKIAVIRVDNSVKSKDNV